MSMFRRPTDSSSDSSFDSSSSEEEEEEDDGEENEVSHNSNGSTTVADEAVGAELTATETLSSADFSLTDNDDVRALTVEDHRTNMLAAVLDELAKYKALEMLNNASAGGGLLTKDSPQVHELGEGIFSRMSQMLDSANLLPAKASSQANRVLRQQYLAGLERFSFRGHDQTSEIGSRRSSADQIEPGSSTALVKREGRPPLAFVGTTQAQLQQLAYETGNLNLVRRPSADFPLGPIINYPSHYENTFEERGILGRGGFGRVYHTVNVLDRREYAVKKIPLSAQLSEEFRRGGHQELTGVLREVQALARLDHCNVVRYYGAWIQAPTVPPVSSRSQLSAQSFPFRGQRLLEGHKQAAQPTLGNVPAGRIRSMSSKEADDFDPFDPFDRDENAGSGQNELWSYHSKSRHSVFEEVSESGHSDIFSDGNVPLVDRHDRKVVDHSSVYVLHVQMSMYPMTLAQYIDRQSSPRFRPASHAHRHCFHLVPAMRIMLAILAGVMYIHRQGLIHRDIKPTNIFLESMSRTPTGSLVDGFVDVGSCPTCLGANGHRSPSVMAMNPRIGDFGLVAEFEKVASGEASPAHVLRQDGSPALLGGEKVVGTEYYTPPPFYYSSQLTSGKGKMKQPPIPRHIIDEKLDVFALGVIFLELLCACSTRMQRITMLDDCQRGVLPSSLKENIVEQGYETVIAERVVEVIHGMIEPDPAKRWGCDMVRHVLLDALHNIQKTPP